MANEHTAPASTRHEGAEGFTLIRVWRFGIAFDETACHRHADPRAWPDREDLPPPHIDRLQGPIQKRAAWCAQCEDER